MSETYESEYQNSYREHYKGIDKVYPSVFALKIFLGRNPLHDMRHVSFAGKKILDVGFGDGRDLLLFADLGFEVSGVEVDPEVVDHTKRKFDEYSFDLRVGFNDECSFEHETFDYVYSCAALMYLRNMKCSILNTLRHMHSKLKPNGQLMGTFTRADSHITKDATWIDKNRLIVTDPFYNQRKGQLYYVHNSAEEVVRDLDEAGFSGVKVHEFNADWFGTRETAFLFVATK